MVTTAVIVATDERGLHLVFGVPAVRRLVLLAHAIGIATVHIASHQEKLFEALSDLIAPEAFHAVRAQDDLDRIVGKISLCNGDRVLVARADHIIDRKSLKTLAELESPDKHGVYSMRSERGDQREAIFTAGRDRVAALQTQAHVSFAGFCRRSMLSNTGR